MFLRDMLNKEFDEVDGRKRLFNVDIVFMAVIVKSYRLTIVGVDAGKPDDRSFEITTDVF